MRRALENVHPLLAFGFGFGVILAFRWVVVPPLSGQELRLGIELGLVLMALLWGAVLTRRTVKRRRIVVRVDQVWRDPIGSIVVVSEVTGSIVRYRYMNTAFGVYADTVLEFQDRYELIPGISGSLRAH